MLKKFLKKAVISISSIYLVNIFLNVINVFIPFNIISILIVGFLDIPGIIALVIISFIM